ncbi:MAG: cob(I)yrinic acid a,c-diamide adenosyltransferase [candidate division Zixibacteria bacterium]|nr:cob(I)yrinic acid a,c-diamide adenosyltransferase [candidate division Zixibacteria bacterium]
MEEQSKPIGLTIVYTGNGKGKTTASLGLCVRAVGYNHKVCVVQFVKGSWKYGEIEGIKRLEPEVEFHTMGKGFVGIIDDELPFEEHQKAAYDTLEFARGKLVSGDFNTIILDEINVAVNLGLIEVEDVLKLIEEKPEKTHLVLTGRYATEEVIEKADLVTEMTEIKHPYQKGILAQIGVDY